MRFFFIRQKITFLIGLLGCLKNTKKNKALQGMAPPAPNEHSFNQKSIAISLKPSLPSFPIKLSHKLFPNLFLQKWYRTSSSTPADPRVVEITSNCVYNIYAYKYSLCFHWDIDKPECKSQHTYICPPNRNDVFRIGQRVRLIFFNSGHPIGSGYMCPQIKSIYFLVLWTQKLVKKA